MRTEPIPNDLFTLITEHRTRRTALAQKVGVAWLEFDLHVTGWKEDIRRSTHEEQRAVETYLENELGIKLDQTNVKANYDTGEFLIEE